MNNKIQIAELFKRGPSSVYLFDVSTISSASQKMRMATNDQPEDRETLAHCAGLILVNYRSNEWDLGYDGIKICLKQLSLTKHNQFNEATKCAL